MSTSTLRELIGKNVPTVIVSQYKSRGEQMPDIDSIILNTAGHVSAYGFSGLHEAVKFLSDYSLQLEMVREVRWDSQTINGILHNFCKVFPAENIHVIDGENMIKVVSQLLIL